MPRVDPSEYRSLPLEAFRLVTGFSLHDVWLVELQGEADCTVPDLRRLLTSGGRRTLSPIVRALFFLRSILGRAFHLDQTSGDGPARRMRDQVTSQLANASTVPPGMREGPFETLYVLPHEAAYQVLNATVHAVVSVAVVETDSGHRLFWATYVKPVGRITAFYMGLIDPFRRKVVYPGLESWLKRAWLERRGTVTGRGLG